MCLVQAAVLWSNFHCHSSSSFNNRHRPDSHTRCVCTLSAHAVCIIHSGMFFSSLFWLLFIPVGLFWSGRGGGSRRRQIQLLRIKSATNTGFSLLTQICSDTRWQQHLAVLPALELMVKDSPTWLLNAIIGRLYGVRKTIHSDCTALVFFFFYRFESLNQVDKKQL